jgi:hypothetical protein
MRTRLILRLAMVLAITMAAGAAMARGIGVAHTSNPGSNGYYLVPYLTASPLYEYVYVRCQAQHLGYGDTVVVSGTLYSCP